MCMLMLRLRDGSAKAEAQVLTTEVYTPQDFLTKSGTKFFVIIATQRRGQAQLVRAAAGCLIKPFLLKKAKKRKWSKT